MTDKKVKGNTVQLTTFKKWSLGDAFGYRICNEDGKQLVNFVWCKICARHSEQIKKDSRIRGQALADIEKFIIGTNFVSKHTVTRHLSSNAHRIGVEFEQLVIVKEPNNDTENLPGPSASKVIGVQPAIKTALANQGREAYRKLLRTAYLIAVDGQPLSSFKTMIRVQKANGVQLISGYDNSNRAREFIHCIADTLRQKLREILLSTNAFTVLSDGSQARKTGSEKELVMVRVLYNGKPTFFCISLQNIDDYGDANAHNLKLSIDNAFKGKIVLSSDQYAKKMICATADGASVNTGIYNGLLTQLKNDDRPWLLTLHCVSHRVELAIKDVLMKNKHFESVKDFLVTLYYLFKRSGKFTHHFHSTADALGVQIYKFKKVHGTRFANHQRRGLETLLHNWIVLAIAVENSLSNTSKTISQAKITGILKKLKDFSFLSVCCLYKHILDQIATLSLKFEKDDLLAFEVLPAIEKTSDRLQDLIDQESSPDELTAACGIQFHRENNEISCMLLKAGDNRKKAINREYKPLSYQGMTNIVSSSTTIRILSSQVLPAIRDSLKNRFSSFESSIFRQMMWLDPANWGDVDDDIKNIQDLANHFESTLALANFNTSEANLKREWKDLRRTVKYYYSNISPKKLWNKIIHYRKQEFPNTCLLAEVALCIGVSNSNVECGFSHLTSMLSDRRLSLGHSTMEDILIIKINNLVMEPNERDELMNLALENYMSSKRKQKLEEDDFVFGVPYKRRRVSDTSESESEESETQDFTDEDDDDDNDDEHSDNDNFNVDFDELDAITEV